MTAETGCTWTASSSASWLAVTSGTSGSGNGTIGYTGRWPTWRTRLGRPLSLLMASRSRPRRAITACRPRRPPRPHRAAASDGDGHGHDGLQLDGIEQRVLVPHTSGCCRAPATARCRSRWPATRRPRGHGHGDDCRARRDSDTGGRLVQLHADPGFRARSPPAAGRQPSPSPRRRAARGRRRAAHRGFTHHERLTGFRDGRGPTAWRPTPPVPAAARRLPWRARSSQ